MPTEKIGLIAGGGELPSILYDHCKSKNTSVKIAALKNFALTSELSNSDTKYFRIGQVGKIINFFKSNDIKKICLIGKVSRPNLITVFPDSMGIMLIFRMFKVYRKGDNKLFSKISEFIEEQGLKIVGAHEIFPELLANEGSIGTVTPTKEQLKDIEKAYTSAKQIGEQDTGQAIIYGNGKSILKEDIKGTNNLIERFSALDSKCKDALLVKVKKPNQDERIDLPTIGMNTIERCAAAGIKGIVLDAGASLIVNRSECRKLADENNIFIYGLNG